MFSQPGSLSTATVLAPGGGTSAEGAVDAVDAVGAVGAVGEAGAVGGEFGAQVVNPRNKATGL